MKTAISTLKSYYHCYSIYLLVLLLIIISFCGIALTQYGPASFDAPILLWFRTSENTLSLAGPEWILDFWRMLTWLGNTTPRILVALLAVMILISIKRWRNAVFITYVLLTGISFSTVLKHWIARPRPEVVSHLDSFSSMSFPSGHAFNSTLFYLAIAITIAPLINQRILRYMLYCSTLILSIATGVSRLALGVHWPTDVIAGWLLAVIWTFLWLEITKRYWPKLLC